jgi:hypothetical protein
MISEGEIEAYARKSFKAAEMALLPGELLNERKNCRILRRLVWFIYSFPWMIFLGLFLVNFRNDSRGWLMALQFGGIIITGWIHRFSSEFGKGLYRPIACWEHSIESRIFEWRSEHPQEDELLKKARDPILYYS